MLLTLAQFMAHLAVSRLTFDQVVEKIVTGKCGGHDQKAGKKDQAHEGVDKVEGVVCFPQEKGKKKQADPRNHQRIPDGEKQAGEQNTGHEDIKSNQAISDRNNRR